MPEALNNLPDDLGDFERQLAALTPAGPALTREDFLFNAGRSAGEARAAGTRRSLRLWQSACAAMLLLTVGILSLRPVKTVEVVKYLPTPDALPGSLPHPPLAHQPIPLNQDQGPTPSPSWSGAARAAGGPANSYLRLRQQALDTGVVLLQSATASPAGTARHSPRPLRPAEGLDALPPWQRRSLNPGEPL